MSMKKSKFIEIIKKLIEREKMKEASTSANVPGYMTPRAFSGKGSKDGVPLDRRNSIASGSGYKKVNEEITSAGYSEIGKRGRYLPLATKEFIKALKKQDDREVIKNIEYIADLMDFMKDTLKNKKYNESINEQSKVIKSIDNLAKKNKYGTVTGTRMNGKTANMIMKIYNHPKMKKRQKDLDNLTSDELANLTIDRDVIRILGLNEGKYHDYRNDETLTPRQKIGHSMREIRNTLSELNKMIDMNVRLKNELNVDSRSYWKNTHKALSKISERLVKLANKVGKLQ